MTSFAESLISLIGKSTDEPQVHQALLDYDIVDVRDDPPFRCYVRSKKKGVSLLVENNEIIVIQFYVEPTKWYSAFSEPLPFGIRAGMTQNQLHHLLGPPNSYDEFDSKYLIDYAGKRIQITIVYHNSDIITYLGVGRPYQ